MPSPAPKHVNDAGTVRRLCEANMPLLTWWLRRAVRRFPSLDYDELRSVGNYGLFRAAQHYMPERGEFSSYAQVWMTGLARNIIRSSRSRPTYREYGKRLLWRGQCDARAAEAVVDEWVALCDHPRAGVILRGLLLERRTMRELAQSLGLHHTRVGQLLNRFRARIEQAEAQCVHPTNMKGHSDEQEC
jgi:RNA polymerase sigma factor (sigma-70 family)